MSDFIGIEPVVFTDASTDVPCLKFQYRVDGRRVQFHIWPDGDSFPDWVEGAVKSGLSSIPEDRLTLDFVPEVNSWYLEVRYGLGSPTSAMVETLIGRIGSAASSYV